MKRIIECNAVTKDKAYRDGERILRAAKELLDIMDSTSSDIISNNDLLSLYDELVETIPALQVALRSKTLEF